MTDPNRSAPHQADHGSVATGAISARTTKMLRHLLGRVTVGELVRSDPVVQALLHRNPGARS